MATSTWALLFTTVAGKVWQTTLSTGDTSAPLSLDNNLSEQVSVQVTGTIAGSTVAVQGSLDAVNYVTVADSNGTAMTYTVIGNLVTIGPALVRMQVTVTAGAAAGLVVTVFVPQPQI